MISGYRIVKKKWADKAFDGEGARLFGGRWNSPGQRCVYLAASESLAILEILVHLNHSAILSDYRLFKINFARRDVLTLDEQDWPENWQESPAPEETALIGDQWLQTQASLALSVPSTIVPREYNYLLNPSHPAFIKAEPNIEALPFRFDPRLLARG